jgi:hypothetical protein
LREPNLGKTNPCVSLTYSLVICFAPSLADSFIFLTLTRLVVVIIFVNFSFALFTPPLGDYQYYIQTEGDVDVAKTVRSVCHAVPLPLALYTRRGLYARSGGLQMAPYALQR